MSKALHVRPSHLLGVDAGSFWSWCVDSATFTFGRHIDNEMDEAEGRLDKGKEAQKARTKQKRVQMVRAQVLSKYLDKGSATSIRGRFRDPAVLRGADGRRRPRGDSRTD